MSSKDSPAGGVLVKAGVYDRRDVLTGLHVRRAVEEGLRLDAGALAAGPTEWFVFDDDLHERLDGLAALAHWQEDLLASCHEEVRKHGVHSRVLVATLPVHACPPSFERGEARG